MRKAGSQLAQSEPVAVIAVKADDNGEVIWGDAPDGAKLIFVLEAPTPGKNYRLAKMVTTAASSAQIAYFRHKRSSLLGILQSDGTVRKSHRSRRLRLILLRKASYFDRLILSCLESQRDSINQPMVARRELPWVIELRTDQP